MKKSTIILICAAVLGWICAGGAIYWGLHRCSGNETELSKELNQVKLTKQNPVSTFVDSSGREHVKYNDGTVAKLPQNTAKQKLYTDLRDGMAGAINDLLTEDPSVKIVEATKVTTKTNTIIPRAALDSIPVTGFLQLDPWTKLYNNGQRDVRVEQDAGLNRTRYTQKGGLFKLWDVPYISFFSDNPNAKIEGYEKYSTPLPMYKPRLRIYGQADYNITLKRPSSDLGLSFRIGRLEAVGFGRVELEPITLRMTPSYGAGLRYNILEL